MPDPLLNSPTSMSASQYLRRISASWSSNRLLTLGAADDDLMSRRIAEQEAELELLTKRRDELSQTRS